ncbi:MAG: VIT and VWA domain-containing protein [Deltaproteobacteria bacterium]|jgi:Ca-activated chloride channel family protein|nr:VIT and VWA domain-containing protein [Deltaproteobacteria bacterium]
MSEDYFGHPSNTFTNEIVFNPASQALKSVSFKGKLRGLLLTMTCKQNYENDDTLNKELVYNFPLSSGAKLMSLKFTLNGKEFLGDVYPKKEAEERYDNAINEGDTPILLSESTPGLYTANLGNIKPGDVATVEFTYEELQRFEGDRIRICIPTVLAPRYGDMVASGELKPHENFHANVLATYPLSLSVDILGDIGKATISTPNHKSAIKVDEDRVNVTLNAGTFLDRDFVLLLEDIKDSQRSYALSGYDEFAQNHTLLLSCSPTGLTKQNPVSLKILLDCSGSMDGPSMRQSKILLRELIDSLTPKDYVSYNIFGNELQSITERLVPVTDTHKSQLLRFVDKTSASLGGTNLNDSLNEVLNNNRGRISSPDMNHAVLLITDAEVADSPTTISLAKESGQRVFSLGVGYSPVESLLAQLSEATGGAYEIAGPNEDMRKVAQRVLNRLRVAYYPIPRIDWGQGPLWSSKLPQAIYNNETFHVFAAFSDKPKTPPKVIFEMEGGTFKVAPNEILETKGQDLSRLKGEVMFRECFHKSPYHTAGDTNNEKALEIALGYKLISPITSYFLVSVRAEGDKADTIPLLENVPQMLAHGYENFHRHGSHDFTMACKMFSLPVNMVASCDIRMDPNDIDDPLAAWAKELKEFLRAADSKAPSNFYDVLLSDILDAPLPTPDRFDPYDYLSKRMQMKGLKDRFKASRLGLKNCIGILEKNALGAADYQDIGLSSVANALLQNKNNLLNYFDNLPFLSSHEEIKYYLPQVILDEIDKLFPKLDISQAEIWCYIFLVNLYFDKSIPPDLLETLKVVINDSVPPQESMNEMLAKIIDVTIVSLLFPFDKKLVRLLSL